MKRITPPASAPSASRTSLRTLRRRSSNCPRNLAPAIRAPRSRETRRCPLRASGTSPATIRWASSSAMAVLPTPGSPIRTGLFLPRRESTCIRRRISVSRPITGSRSPARAAAVRSRPNCSRAVGSCSSLRPFSGAAGSLGGVLRTEGRWGAAGSTTGAGGALGAGAGRGPARRRSSGVSPCCCRRAPAMRRSSSRAAKRWGTSMKREPH